ncbi:hypothetical protein JVU11DRAFT_5670 [Chiua virens]|nr:hypothetical protein JVU11DRAFT_5670 [Chiua virens]
MANDHAKNAGPVAQEHPYPPAMSPYGQPIGAAYPPGYPVYYAQPPDSSHGENTNGSAPAPQYMIPFPAAPGMIYPYPPPPPGQGVYDFCKPQGPFSKGQIAFPQYAQSTPPASNGQRPKRKQVKMACTNCANACKRCNEARPCERCVKYGIQNTCVDGVRKERQKGIKRGPYKRKNKSNGGNSDTSFVATNGESEWEATTGTPQTPAGGQPPPPPIQAIAHYPPPPEGFYPYFYPPPPGFIPPGHDGQSGAEGGPNGAAHPPPLVSYYPIAPPGFFPHYGSVAPGAFTPPLNGAPVATIDPTEASKNTEGEGQHDGPAPTGKKRARRGKSGDAKTKKQKAATAVTTQESPTSGGTIGGSDHASEQGANSPAEQIDTSH